MNIWLGNPFYTIRNFRIDHGEDFQKINMSVTYFLDPSVNTMGGFIKAGLKMRNDLQIMQRAHMVIAKWYDEKDLERLASYHCIGDHDSYRDLDRLNIEYESESVLILKNRITPHLEKCYLYRIPDETHQMAVKLAVG